MIVTFYSYKGGVGRSMALANVAEWYRQRGLRVVMVDWDLEAPGLETFFTAAEEGRATVRAQLGLVDLLQTYRELFPGLPCPPAAASGDAPGAAASRREEYIALLGQALPPLRHMLAPLPPPSGSALPPLWLLPAGNRSPDRFDSYAEAVQQFDWSAFYAHYEGEAFFEWMRRQLLDAALADVVLIDSRTGVTEMSGVCTRQLADAVVMLCAPNDQNLDGVAKMARSFTRPDLAAARSGAPLRLLMVPSRLDVSEGRPIDLFEARFRSRLDVFLPDALRGAGTDFLQLRIPYISAYAFDERLAVGDPQGVKALQHAYGSLATHLALLAPAGSALRTRCAPALRERFGLPVVVVLALTPAQAAAAAEVRRALESSELLMLPEPADAAEAEALVAEVGAVQRQGLSLLVVTDAHDGPVAALRHIRQRCRELGVALQQLPAPLQGPVLPDEQAWASLRLSLRHATAAPRVPMLAPPPRGELLGRERELELLQRALVAREGGAQERTVALTGAAGTGKTALARTVARMESVVDHFDGGVLWLTLGGRPDLRAGLAKIVGAFDGAVATGTVEDLDDLQRRAAEAMRTRRCLVVVEDAESATVLESVPRGGPGSVRLVTTRSRELAALVGDQVVDIGEGLYRAAALELLLAGVDGVTRPTGVEEIVEVGDGGPADRANEIVDLLGSVPLALQLANAQLRAGMRRTRDAPGVMGQLVERLRREGVTALDPAVTSRADTSLYAAMVAETEPLRSVDRERLHRLASLPAGQAYTLAEAAASLELAPAEAAGMLERLEAIGWVSARDGGYVTGALAHATMRSLSLREEEAQHTRIRRATPAHLRLYLSYRRSDTAEVAARVHARLTEEFGRDAVFFDHIDISLGEVWAARVERALSEATAVIVLIGPHWLSKREDSYKDIVGDEIARALAQEKLVIPVLVSGAVLPPASVLPVPVRALARRQALEVRDDTFNMDLDRLVKELQQLARSTTAGRPAAQASAAGAEETPGAGGLTGWLKSLFKS